MQRSFQVRLRMAGLAAVMALAAALLYGCNESAKPMSAESKAKYEEMMKSGNAPGGPGRPGSGGGGGGSNGPR